MTRAELARQVRQHLDSLAGAGVQWLGRTSATPIVPAAADAPTPAPAATEASVAKKAAILTQRRKELAVLAEEVTGCTRCPELASSRTQTVFGVGPPGVDLCFVGEAPGADEDTQGEPFVGAAGQLLNRIIKACGFEREEVYICNTLKCRPPNNRTPLPDEMANCRGFLERQIELVQPRFICALGGSAAQSLLQLNTPLGKLRRTFHDFRGIPVVCTYHPAYLLPHRAPDKKKDVWEDMKMLLERMGRPIPTPEKK